MLNNPLQLIQMLSGAGNPLGMLQSMAAGNPQLQKALDMAQNKSPEEFKQYVKNVCSTQNIDIASLAKQYNLPIKF